MKIMKKEIKNFGKYVEITLIVLTFVSLVLSSLAYTSMIYDSIDNTIYHTAKLNSVITSTTFNILFWVDNLLIYFVSIFYVIDTIREKKNVLLKISFCLFSICTTIVASLLIINFIAKLFGVL